VQQLVYECGKLLCCQSGKGLKEDQKGEAFMVWLAQQNDISTELKALHLSMKPVIGSRYVVYHYNPRVIYSLRGVYLRFLEHLRATKTPKPHLNRLEKSAKTLLEDPKCVAQVRLHRDCNSDHDCVVTVTMTVTVTVDACCCDFGRTN
jgi:hypothetical protein